MVTVNNPDSLLRPEQRDQELANHANYLSMQLNRLQNEYADNVEIIRFSTKVFVFNQFICNHFATAIKTGGDPKASYHKLIEFWVNVYDKVHFMMPQLRLKELCIGWAEDKSDLLHPTIPNYDPALKGKDDEIMKRCGFQVINGKRNPLKDYELMNIRAKIFFAMHFHENYIGRGLLFLQTFVTLPFHHMSSQVLSCGMELLGSKLMRLYKRVMVNLCKRILEEWIPEFSKYTPDGPTQGGVWNEPQNRPEMVSGVEGALRKADVGLDLVKNAKD